MNSILEMPVGIIDILWDYDDYDEKRKAFYQLTITNKNNMFEYKNNYYFLNDDLFVMKEETISDTLKIRILSNNLNEKIKIEICGDVLFLTKEQYTLLNESITKLQLKHKFDFEIVDNSIIRGH